MTDTSTKREGCPGRHPQQTSPAKGQLVYGKGIRIPERHKKIISRVNRALWDAFECLDEIENNIKRSEGHFYAENTASLRRVVSRFKRLCRAVGAVADHAKREDAR